MRHMVLALALLPSGAAAWERLDTDTITEVLNDTTVQYDAHTVQHFRSDGSTDYITERYSAGRWAARENRYCSVWPPSDLWTCYDVDVRGAQIRFISDDGSISEGTLQE